jgi:hypothetical protein
MPPRRETTYIDTAIINTDSRVREELSPGSTPLQEKGSLDKEHPRAPKATEHSKT